MKSTIAQRFQELLDNIPEEVKEKVDKQMVEELVELSNKLACDCMKVAITKWLKDKKDMWSKDPEVTSVTVDDNNCYHVTMLLYPKPCMPNIILVDINDGTENTDDLTIEESYTYSKDMCF